MGSPEINASFFPTVVGEVELDRWQVQIIKDFNLISIVYSDRPMLHNPSFYIYMKESKEYIPVKINLPSDNITWSGGMRVELKPPLELVAHISRLDPYDFISIDFSSWGSLQQIMAKLRPYWAKPSVGDKEPSLNPDTVIVGGQQDSDRESAEAWSSFFWPSSSSPDFGSYILGRTKPNQIVLPPPGSEAIPIGIATDVIGIKLHMESPIESMVTSQRDMDYNHNNGNFAAVYDEDDDVVQTRGNLQTMRDISAEYTDRPLSENEMKVVPTIRFRASVSTIGFTSRKFHLDLNFSFDSSLSKAKVIGGKLSFRVIHANPVKFQFALPSSDHSIGAYESITSDGARWIDRNLVLSLVNATVSDFENLKLDFSSPIPINEHYNERNTTLSIAGIRLSLDLEMPLEDVDALYASGKFYDTNPQPQPTGNSIAQSVRDLIDAVKIDYTVNVISQLNEAQYGTAIRNESALLRDKLRSLAAESGTLIKFSQTSNEVILQSISRMQPHTPIEIDLFSFVLTNNIYSFKMESPDKNDIASSVVISWGKDAVTGKYNHIFEVNATGVYSDGSFINPDPKWDPVLSQLQKNASNNLGTAKNLETEWIMDQNGAEIMAYDYLCWNCTPLRKAQAECIMPKIKEIVKIIDGQPHKVDIGEFVRFDLPGYPPKFHNTSWVVTGMYDDLDKHVTTIEVLEAWNMPAVPENRYLLMENGKNILLEDSEKIKLEKISNG